MFTSLKSRLWLTYALIISLVLGAVGISILVSLRKSPLVYRQPLAQLEAVAGSTLNRIFSTTNANNPESTLLEEARKSKTRLAVYRSDGTLVFDTDSLPGNRINLPNPITASTPGEVQFINDRTKRAWLYTVQPIDGKTFLLASIRLPRLPLLIILGNELFTPFVRAAILSLLLAVVLAIILGNWVEAPLLKLSQQAEAVSRGDAKPIPIQGPTEVRQLSSAFNEMVTKLNISQQSQRDFIANVSHELKTPLTSIQGFAQAILDQKLSCSEETRQSAGIILDESHRMNKLVIGLLTLARLDAGMTDSKQESIDLSALLRNVLERLKPQAQSAEVTIREDMEAVPSITADAESLTQVFVNLVDNAIKYSKRNGTVTVTCHRQGDALEVHVRDNGVGISPADQSRIFERFYQTDKSRRGGVKRGVGLGLAIASQLIKSMGGIITVQSEPGEGSDFMVKLPLA